MAAGRKLPNFGTGIGAQAKEFAVTVLVKPFADVQLAVRDTRRRENGLHSLVVVKCPDILAGRAIQTIESPIGFEDAVVGRGDIDAVTVHQRRGRYAAFVRRAEGPNELAWCDNMRIRAALSFALYHRTKIVSPCRALAPHA